MCDRFLPSTKLCFGAAARWDHNLETYDAVLLHTVQTTVVFVCKLLKRKSVRYTIATGD